jgi:glycine/D-amino acid oxidase-like deaminating enzyme
LSARQRRLRTGRPLWLPDRARQTPRYPVFSGQHDTVIAIVGGGMPGALVAPAFASEGISATVLEAAAVGRGSTAASLALLLKEPDLGLTELTKRYGSRRRRRIWELSHQSVTQLIALLKRLRIRCDLTIRDAVYYATSAQAAERLRRECDVRARSGFDAVWLSPAELRRRTGMTGHGAILSPRSAQFDPYRACRGILRAAVTAGARVFERSEVRRIARTSRGVRITTRRGTLCADQVIIATGYATPQFRPLAGRFRLYRTYVLATENIDRRRRDAVGLSDVMGVGHQAALSLCSVGARTSAPHRRRGPARATRSTPSSTVPDRVTRSAGVLRRQTLRPDERENRVCLGGAVRDDARQPSVHRPTPSISASLVRARLWRQRHDLRVPGGSPTAGAMAGRHVSRSCVVRVRSYTQAAEMRIEDCDAQPNGRFRVELTATMGLSRGCQMTVGGLVS